MRTFLTKHAFAKRIGVDTTYIDKLVKDGKLSTLKDGRLALDQALREMKDFADPAQPKRGKGKKGLKLPKIGSDPNTVTFADVKKAKEFYGSQLQRLKYELESGRLVDAASVKKAAFDQYRIVRDTLLAIPDRISSLIAAERSAEKVHELLTREIRLAVEAITDVTRP
jgi:hypothetical protein